MIKYSVIRKKRFKKHYKNISRLKNFDREKFESIIIKLSKGETLDRIFRDHSLSGRLSGFREFHLEYNILIMYIIDEENHILNLVDIGTHPQLFN